MPSRIPISDLETITAVTNSHYLAVDNGTTTNKITVEKFNESASTSAASYAQSAADSASAAATSASTASDLASEINNKLNTASTLVSSASTYADNASASASAASNSATAASGSATSASNSATSAASSVTAAEQKANLAKSWAVGNTGERADEAVNNAAYWASVAQGAAGGGVTTFNGRSGAVISQAHDYNAEKIDYVNTTSGLTATDTQAAIDEVDSTVDGINTKIGITDISAIGDGKITGAIASLNTGKENAPTVLNAQTLSVGSTTLTFTDSSIGNNSRIRVLSNPFTTGLINAVQSGTTVTLTFEEQEVAISVSLEVRN